ncbi:NUDIX domain-containing protein [Halomarina halobia]|uniref:NUDIX domain-containing protein n=1 Tax=Halomarina halobia TaxID=3033386 RepID=A0ABD6ABG5_9EURY|nr:NUDIX domain-containing protein [Halomarina sp. PSR21]
MSVSDTHERVSDYLRVLDGSYSGFTVRQTTLSVRAEVYDRMASLASAGVVDAAVRVRNATDEVLAVREAGDGWTDPYGLVRRDETIESGARRSLRERTGIDAALDDLLGVTIVCLTDATNPDRDSLYRLSALFSGRYVGGEPESNCAWRSRPPRSISAI